MIILIWSIIYCLFKLLSYTLCNDCHDLIIEALLVINYFIIDIINKLRINKIANIGM